jgi:hypothetical protein
MTSSLWPAAHPAEEVSLNDRAANVMTPLSPVESSQIGATPGRLTTVQWLICAVACLGFTFDLYEGLMMPLIVRPLLVDLGHLAPGSRDFNLWVGLLLFVPTAIGGIFGALGGYLTDLLGRRRVLVWSILLYDGGMRCELRDFDPGVSGSALYDHDRRISRVCCGSDVDRRAVPGAGATGICAGLHPGVL